MRVSSQVKEATRESILSTARRLFLDGGWERTTTRLIASEAGIASGTVFNYFTTKEAIAVELMMACLRIAEQEYRSQRRGDELLEEDLFALIWTGFRSLAPFRGLLASAHAVLLSPLATAAAHPGEPIRALQLEALERIGQAHGYNQLAPVQVQLYWTLYLGELAHWAADGSPHQEDSLALLDQSLIVFCAALRPTHTDISGPDSDAEEIQP
jgi:AcrR family transcriptional regulator